MTGEIRRLVLAGTAGVVLVAAGGLGISALVDIPVGISAEPVGAGDRLAGTASRVQEAPARATPTPAPTQSPHRDTATPSPRPAAADDHGRRGHGGDD